MTDIKVKVADYLLDNYPEVFKNIKELLND